MAAHAPILLYHRVGPLDGSSLDRFTVSPATFVAQMRWIARMRWNVVAIDQLVGARLEACPGRALAITFDDGFACNREHAWPVLRSLGFPAATFIVTDRLGQCNDWDSAADPRYPLLSREDIVRTDVAMTFHSHSATHAELPALANADASAALAELARPRAVLAGLPQSGNVFAYPFGAWNWDLKLAVERADYAAACTCIEGLNVEILERDVGLRLEAKLRSGRELWRWPPARPAWLVVALARARRRGGPLASRRGP
jgi:peptidoglycan/xylan/chitin deacetylase (PgdA/CDA1 family)